MPMQNLHMLLISLLITLPCTVGCYTSSDKLIVGKPPKSAGGNPLVWIESEFKHKSTTISLGYRAGKPHDEGWVEPVAMLTRNGEFAPDAMVFHRLVDADGKQILSEEVATVYENAEGDVAGLYTQGKHRLPKDVSNCIVRFRIVLADLPDDAKPLIRDIIVP